MSQSGYTLDGQSVAALRDLLRALRNARGDGGVNLRYQPGVGLSVSGLSRSSGGPSGGGGGSELAWFKVVSSTPNWLVCRTWDGQSQGADEIPVAKVPLLRHGLGFYPWLTSFSSFTADDVSIATGTISERWAVTPPYFAGELILAVKGQVPVPANNGSPDNFVCQWADININAHAWAVIYT